ncbi:hypothetical protein MUN78_16385 [Leucobacter allii]|uniref:Uncharacterized protein n=1 Tax=Leucobacter allii TaxID=2932247 RepID=A0ABY4FLR4_9MICO|nr:hypothetical protein [Leucobacter allii]UOQ57208.1 hypothetical protein MUN78_16385 [Leucobacter allii]
MKSMDEVRAEIAVMRANRSYADSCVEMAVEDSSRAYWVDRVSELTQRIWALEWVLS